MKPRPPINKKLSDRVEKKYGYNFYFGGKCLRYSEKFDQILGISFKSKIEKQGNKIIIKKVKKFQKMIINIPGTTFFWNFLF